MSSTIRILGFAAGVVLGLMVGAVSRLRGRARGVGARTRRAFRP
jgi:hypothetical protein